MKDFILENWRIIVEIVCLIGSVIFFLLKKKPVQVVDLVKTIICELLPQFIFDAEKTNLKGADKVEYVLASLKKYLRSIGCDLTQADAIYAREQIEHILSTPQKKG